MSLASSHKLCDIVQHKKARQKLPSTMSDPAHVIQIPLEMGFQIGVETFQLSKETNGSSWGVGGVGGGDVDPACQI